MRTKTAKQFALPCIFNQLFCELLWLHLVPRSLRKVQRFAGSADTSCTILSVAEAHIIN